MEAIIQFVFAHAPYAHWIIFGALLLTGFSLPISEDLLIIISAILASTIMPERLYVLFGLVFLGCFISDMIVYWIGRTLGYKLWKYTRFCRFSSKKMEKVKKFYKTYGIYAFLIGRFIPFGLRNCLFFTAGMGSVSFKKFLIRDGIACLFSNTVLFYLTYTLGKNYQIIYSHLKTINLVLLGVVAIGVTVGVILYHKSKSRKIAASSVQNNGIKDD